MPIETYEQALAFWHNRVNYEQRGMPTDLHELKLDRMRALLERLGNPHEYPLQPLRGGGERGIIHIAGSKGKGSTAAMIAAILQRAGHRTGLFTSPHLSRVEERVQVDGVPITFQALTQRMQEIEPAVLALDAAGMPPTFFEIVTALGFLHFRQEAVEFVVLEVGLGGRFDSTNVCKPLVSVITSISLDHTQQLGDTLPLIAREKAGIIKPGVPVVHGVTAPEARAVIREVAHANEVRLRELGEDFGYQYEPGVVGYEGEKPARVRLTMDHATWSTHELGLMGRHQAANAAVAVATIEVLRDVGCAPSDWAVAQGLREVHWPARVEVVGRRPLVVLDCAHNVASIEALLETLQESFPQTRRVLLFAGSNDKDLAGMLRLLTPHFEQAVFTRYQGSARAAGAEELLHHWQQHGGKGGEVHPYPSAAWQAARAAASSDDLIVITGSVFLAGELRPALTSERRASGPP